MRSAVHKVASLRYQYSAFSSSFRAITLTSSNSCTSPVPSAAFRSAQFLSSVHQNCCFVESLGLDFLTQQVV